MAIGTGDAGVTAALSVGILYDAQPVSDHEKVWLGHDEGLETFGFGLLRELEMQERSGAWRLRVRVRVAAMRRPANLPPWWIWAAFVVGLLGSMPVWAQTTVVPEREAPTLPPGAGGDQGLSRPDSEAPAAPLDGSRPVPDRGVVAPPPMSGSTPVIRPPVAGTMPVIPPPGSAGGDKSVVPK